MAATYTFLSEEWIKAAKALREEYAGKLDVPSTPVKLNLVVTDTPFDKGDLQAHIDTTGGDPRIDLGHIESPDLTITSTYETAKALFVQGDQQAAMQAFLAGQVKVDGDVTKLMTLQMESMNAAENPAAKQLTAHIQEMTA